MALQRDVDLGRGRWVHKAEGSVDRQGEVLRREMGTGQAAQIWGLCGESLGELLILHSS